MGIFSSSKVNQLEQGINLLVKRMGEFGEFPTSGMHSSVASMFGSLLDQVFKLYYPDQKSLKSETIKVTVNENGKSVTNRMPISYWIAAVFDMGLTMEHEFKVEIFKDEAQRSFARTVSPFG